MSPGAQAPLGQLLLDGLLAAEQPVHGVVEWVLGGIGDAQFLGQGGVEPVPGVGQLGAGEQQAFGDHGEDQIASPRRLGGDELLQSQLADHRQDGVDMAVRERAGDAEGLGRWHEGLALEGAPDDLDEVLGEVGEVTEGLMGDGLCLADRTSEQMGDIGLSLVDPLVVATWTVPVRAGMRLFSEGWQPCQEDFRIFSGYISESKSRSTLCGRMTYDKKRSGTSD